jgi:homoserine kinase
MKQYIIRAPATSANLGAGFDALGIAFDVYNETLLTFSDEKVEDYHMPGFAMRIQETEFPVNEKKFPSNTYNVMYRAMDATLKYLGVKLPANIEMEYAVNIPFASGLGSSAAAIATGIQSGLVIANQNIGYDEIFDIALEFESHLDNIAPAFMGNFTLTYYSQMKDLQTAISFPVDDKIRFTVIAFYGKQSTKEARHVLPKRVVYPRAVNNIANSALLTRIVTGTDLTNEALFDATNDAMHQEFRKQLYPESYQFLQDARKLGLPAVISGAGPAILIMHIPDERIDLALDEFMYSKRLGDLDPIIMNATISSTGVQTIKVDL